MTSPLAARLRLLLSVLSVLAALGLAAAGTGWFLMRGSLAQLDGAAALAGLSAPVRVERDALGVPRIAAATRADVARATGFLHAQERFFQMDLLRRRAAGELAELFGPDAVGLDKQARTHGFRRTAVAAVAALPPEQRELLDAYVAGVNAGLAALRSRPWEYLVLRVAPAPWRAEDSILSAYAMWFELQDSHAHYEQSLAALRAAHGAAGVEFFAPRGAPGDAALDGSTFPVPELPPFRLKAPGPASAAVGPAERDPVPGSNSFAVAGARSASGAAIVANDMHLGLSVPNTWYRAEFRWRDGDGTERRVVGATLPGTPLMVVGSNGSVAWGFTNSYADTVDAVVIETYADLQYRTPEGWKDIEDREELIAVKGAEPVRHTVRWTRWGPLIAPQGDGRYLAHAWTAHAPAAQDLALLGLERAGSVREATGIGRGVGMPNQNLVVADRAGQVAWTLTGKFPRRFGHDGRLPVSRGYGDRGWDGWLRPDEVPVATTDPTGAGLELPVPDGVLWTANNRLVGGEAYRRIGDGGYDEADRARNIRDDLRGRAAAGKLTELDLLEVALADRAPHFERWRKLLIDVLDDAAVAKSAGRRELRDLAGAWDGRATADSAGYRLVRGFRMHVVERVLAPFAGVAQARYERFSFGRFMTEEPVWRLVSERPARLLNPEHPSWESLLLAAADAVLADAERAGRTPAQMTWGARNTLRMQHPFSRFLPGWLAGFLDMPAEPLPGDSGMARVQGRSFGASQRMVVAPGFEERGIFHMPGGQSGHPLSSHYRAGHAAWVRGEPTALLPGETAHTLTLQP
jgi:penicillin G amidase